MRRPDGEPIADDMVDQLQASGDVDWVAPGYRAAGARMRGVSAGLSPEVAQGTGVYAVNPTRVFVHQAASAAAGAVAALSADDRRSRMRGYVPMRVRSGTALTAAGPVASSIAATGATADGAVRFETIPFFSPAMAATVAALCQTVRLSAARIGSPPPHLWGKLRRLWGALQRLG